jgi:hypothetical protein
MQSHIQKAVVDRVSDTQIYYWRATYGNLNNTSNAPLKSSNVWKICLVELTGTVEETKRPEDTNGKASDSFTFVWDDRTSLTFI